MDETDEVLVVSFTYASAQPWAVVVKALDAAVANTAMDGTRGTVDVAG